MIDQSFYEKACQIQDPLTGTENMSPLLYYFIRSTRPQRLLEYGMGYSTLFILKGLEDNFKAFQQEREKLINKKYTIDLPISNQEFNDFFFDKDAAFLNSKLFLDDYQPILICFEKLPPNHDYTKNILQIVKDLGLDKFLLVIHGNACTQSDKIPSSCLPFDFIWNDDDSYYKFFKIYWNLMREHNSYLLFHSTEEATSLGTVELEKIKRALADKNDNEILTMLEPHKLHQNSFTIIRKIGRNEPLHFDIPSHQEIIYKNFIDFKRHHKKI